MATNKKGLQKLTETDKKINELLAKPLLLQSDIDKALTKEEKQILGKILTDQLNELKGAERDKFLIKIDDMLPTETRNELWENNHYSITVAISKLIEDYGKMPTKNHIARETGLSRQTIHKHLNAFQEHPLYAEQIKQFKFMADRVLAKVIKLAVQGEGNIKAARLYFEIIGGLNNQSNTSIKTQNNFIQINGTVLSQETIKQLNPEQLNTIENILKTALPQQVEN
jgi:predicted transcriptional regulator